MTREPSPLTCLTARSSGSSSNGTLDSFSWRSRVTSRRVRASMSGPSMTQVTFSSVYSKSVPICTSNSPYGVRRTAVTSNPSKRCANRSLTASACGSGACAERVEYTLSPGLAGALPVVE
ncbi:Uncharacterised protein [Bordetella pertussis]|nr:Uncharacterised protein [Bordetella pertussis]